MPKRPPRLVLCAIAVAAAALVAAVGTGEAAQSWLSVRPTAGTAVGGTIRVRSIAQSRRVVLAIRTRPMPVTNSTTARIAFSVAAATSVVCRLDGGSAARCASPVNYTGLSVGTHTLTIRADNRLGTRTVTVAWRVENSVAAPTPAPTPTPQAPAPDAPAPKAPAPTAPAPTGGGAAGGGGGAAQSPVPAAPPTPTPTPAPAPAVTPPSVDAPAPPASYALPGGAVRVSTSSQLVAALASGTPSDIVLADGVYDNSSPFFDSSGHRLYAEHRGEAVLRAGLVVGGNWAPGGAVVEGLSFDVSDSSKTFSGSVVHVWGTAKGTRILDVTIDGHGTIGAGIAVRQPDGLVIQRVRLRNLVDYGLLADTNDQSTTLDAPMLIEDVDVAGVSRPVPGSSNGTAEACIWLGNAGTLRRAKLRECAWMGVWTGTANRNSLVEDVDVDSTPVGVYVEHFTTGVTFQQLHVGRNVGTGVNCEWADPSWGGRAACTDDMIQDSTFESRRVGIYLDSGSTRTRVRGCVFVGQSSAAIVDYRGVDNSFDQNDFSRIAAGAAGISTDHL